MIKGADPFLTLRAVAIRHGDQVLFRGLNWEYLRNQRWAVVGPNGSGKSTFVRALMGDLPVVGGEIVYHFAPDDDGRSGWESLGEQQIASVSIEQHRQLVAEAVSFHQARWSPVDDGAGVPTALDVLLNGGATAKSRARRAADVLGIGGLLHRKVQHLSNGEMRKVLLARALARKPELLILDNPYAGLDHGSCAWLHRLVEQLMAEGMHIMVVAQQLEDIPRRTTHMLYIEGGRILAAGPKGALLAWGVGKRLSGGHRRISPVNSIRRRRKTPALPGGPPLVEIRDANVLYGRTSILKDVSWTVHAGESWALLGPNGSGKSTLISLVLGDNPQCYANHVVLFGKRRGTGESVWEVKQRIGWMAPELQFSYESDVTCFEVVCSGFFDSIGLYRMCGQEKRRAVRSWLKDLGLMPLAATPFGRLSDGQQRMVLLARAMVKTPPLLILDEPCQGLDPANRQAVVAVVDAVVRATGSTLIYVAHRQDEIPSCVNHEIRLREGRVTRRRRLRREL